MGFGVCGVWGGWGSRDVLLNHLERDLKTVADLGCQQASESGLSFGYSWKHQTGD